MATGTKAPDLQTKLRAARSRLVVERPFLGGLVLHLPLREASPAWCESTATDARAIYYNPAYIAWLSFEQLQFILAHEALHCALGHFGRRGGRNLTRWNAACDYAVNQLLTREGLTPPPGVLLSRDYYDLSAEEIYPLIPPGTKLQTVDHHAYENGPPPPEMPLRSPFQSGNHKEAAAQEKPASGDLLFPSTENAPLTSSPPPLTAAEREHLSRLWQQRAVGLAQQALQAGKLSAPLQRLIGHLGQPQLPWRQLLAQCLTTLAREDYSFTRPSRREGPALLPRLVSRQLDLVIVLDTSGSIRDEQLQSFLTEISALKGQLQARVILHACDAALCKQGPWIYESWGTLELPASLSGGGDTDFRPPFQWVEQEGLRPHALLYFTDARGEFPEEEPPYPIIWVVKGKATVPWGQRIQLN
jgi:predicted metal-dependent peptidase